MRQEPKRKKSPSSDQQSKKKETTMNESKQGSSAKVDSVTKKVDTGLVDHSHRGYALKRPTSYVSPYSDSGYHRSWRTDEYQSKKYRYSPHRVSGGKDNAVESVSLSDKYKIYLSTSDSNNKKMSPEEFQEFVEKQKKETSEPIDLTLTSHPRFPNPVAKKKYYMNGRYAWKNFALGEFEPRIFFNHALRKIYIRKCVMNCIKHNGAMSATVKEQWVKQSEELSEAIDTYCDSDEKVNELSVDVKMIQDTFKFPVTKYMKWFNVDMDNFIKYVQDYIRCRRDGIEVLKLELNLYLKHTKYLWSPVKLIGSKKRIDFTETEQKKRMAYILTNHIVFVHKDYMFRKKWLNWRKDMIEFCHKFLAYDWPIEERETSRPRYLTLEERLVHRTRFPISYFRNIDDEFDIILHLCDFVYCLHFGIEVEKTYAFEFYPNEKDYIHKEQTRRKKQLEKKQQSVEEPGKKESSTHEKKQSESEVSPMEENDSDDASEEETGDETSKSSEVQVKKTVKASSINLDTPVFDDNTKLHIVSSKGMSTDVESEDIMLNEKEKKDKAIRVNINLFRNIYRQFKGSDELHERYARIVKAEYEFEERFLSRLRRQAIEDYEGYMEMFYEDNLSRIPNLSNYKVSNDKLEALTHEGVSLMEHLHLHRGYNIGFLEDSVGSEYDTKTNPKYDTRCCCCPLANKSVRNSLNISEDGMAFGNYVSLECCNDNAWMARDTLIGHLCCAGYGEGCHMHLAALYYIKHVCLINRKPIHKEHMDMIVDLEFQYTSRPPVVAAMLGDENGDGNTTPFNEMEIEDE